MFRIKFIGGYPAVREVWNHLFGTWMPEVDLVKALVGMDPDAVDLTPQQARAKVEEAGGELDPSWDPDPHEAEWM